MYKCYFKKAIDFILSLILIPLLLIVVFLIGLLIYIEDKGSPFYISLRLGYKGVPFKMVKFRTMKVNAPDIRNSDGSTFNAINDPRLTRIGFWLRKTSLDELPQIFNVFLFQMSLVGPRPDLPEHINFYTSEEYNKLEVLPGITGYNQAYFRNTIPWKKRIENDLYYVKNISFLLDCKIIVETIRGVLISRGVFNK